jgi:nanoRNase/pAp phosphatase (c-di-AMP/oligoRNAs hydrolase)
MPMRSTKSIDIEKEPTLTEAPRPGNGSAPETRPDAENLSGTTSESVIPDRIVPVKQLERVLSQYQGTRLVAFLKGHPDPDSIASALAHRHICEHFGIEVDIFYFEELSRHENKALVKRLDIDLVQWKGDQSLTEYTGFCLVDTQSPDLPIQLPKGMPLVSMVDHHRRLGPINGEFVDIREDAGSTCAIYAEYLSDGPFGLDINSPDSVRLATALIHGIRTDTDDFVTARALDFKAAAYLAPFIDRELLITISEQSISAKSMDILHVALDRKIIKGNYLLAGVGYVREEDRDGIGEAADYLLKREGIDTVLVYGVVGRKTIDGSLRTSSNTVDPDKWIKGLFGADSEGRYYGGGRRDKGGFQIPLGIFARCSDSELLWKTASHIIEDVFFEKIGERRDIQ